MIEAVKLAEFAEKNGWIVIAKASWEDMKMGDDFIRYLSPSGDIVLVRFYANGSIKEIIS